METPKGDKHPHPRFSRSPEIESFAKSDRERKVIQLQRAFRVSGTPFVLPPGTPKERVEILQEAFRKTYRDPEFHKEYKKLTADDPTPFFPKIMKRRSEKFRGIRKRLSSSKSSWARSRCRLAESKKESAMRTKLLVKAFLIVGLAHFTVLPGTLFSQSDFSKEKPLPSSRAGTPAARETCG